MLNDVLPPNHGSCEPMTAIDESREAAVAGAPGVSAVEFREAMGHFATSIGEDGEPVGTTANAVTSLSLDHPLLLVCFDLGSATLGAIRSHGAFVVNVLGHRQRHLSANFARRGLAAAWDGVRHRRGPTGSPRLDGVIAVVECTVEHALPGGSSSAASGTPRPTATARPRWSSGAAATRPSTAASPPSGAAAGAADHIGREGDSKTATNRTQNVHFCALSRGE